MGHLQLNLLLGVVAGCCISLLSGFPTGAPYKSCANLYPKHKGSSGNYPAQLSSPPYNITFTPASYLPGDDVNVTLSGASGSQFKGFQLRARRTTGDKEELVGNFVDLPAAVKSQFWYPQEDDYTNCITHSSRDLKSEVTVTWRAPTMSLGNVIFRATFVEQFNTFWVDVESEELIGNEDNPNSTVDWGTSTQFDPIVTDNKCGSSKGCMLFPTYCSGDNCNYVVTYKRQGDDVTFEVKAKTDGYVTLGLSDDRYMGKDETVTCVNQGNYVSVQYGWNPALYNDRHSIKGFKTIQTSNQDGYIYCRFTRPVVRTLVHITESGGIANKQNVTFDLNNPYYILLAYGSIYAGADVLGKHKEYPLISKSKVDFTQYNIKRADSLPNETKAHAALMIFAWMLFSYLVTTLGSFFQDGFKFGFWPKMVNWFEMHRFFAFLTAILTVASAILIFVKVNGWSTTGGNHSYVGTTVLALVVIQILLGLSRPDKASPNRRAFKVAHAFVAVCAQALANAAIILASQLPILHAQLRLWLLIVFAVSIGINFIWVFIYASLEYIKSQVQCKIEALDVAMDNPGYDTGSKMQMSRITKYDDEDRDTLATQYSKISKSLHISLAFYIVTNILLSVAAVVFIFLF